MPLAAVAAAFFAMFLHATSEERAAYTDKEGWYNALRVALVCWLFALGLMAGAGLWLLRW